MSINRLDVFYQQYRWIVAWDDEGYPGGILGESTEDEEGHDPEHEAASKAARLCDPADGALGGAMYWDDEQSATRALRAARAAVKAHRAAVKAEKAGKPWPDWAKTAKAQGWREPKGWTP